VHDGEIDPILVLWSHFSGYVDTQNNMCWSAESPIVVHEVVLHDVKFGMWCAVSATMTTAPHKTINQLESASHCDTIF
jgi:hypothetical protein